MAEFIVSVGYSCFTCYYHAPIVLFREKAMERDREEKWKKMEIMRFEREGRAVGDGERRAATESNPSKAEDGGSVLTKSQEREGEANSVVDASEEANKDTSNPSNVTKSDT